MPDFDTVVNEL